MLSRRLSRTCTGLTSSPSSSSPSTSSASGLSASRSLIGGGVRYQSHQRGGVWTSSSLESSPSSPGTHKRHLTAASASSSSSSSTSEVKEFQTETKKILDIVARSLYSDREIFIRELVSNASDACEKLRFLQTSGKVLGDPSSSSSSSCRIVISTDETKRLFCIEDNGVGMTKEECCSNLGIIAKSGSLEFLEKNLNHQQNASSADSSLLIGQFGVGFYSTFVVADRVDVFTRPAPTPSDPSPLGWHWSSDGGSSYTIASCDPATTPDMPLRGTKIICHLKEECKEFADYFTAKQKAQNFSNFINFPLITRKLSAPTMTTSTTTTSSSTSEDETTNNEKQLSGDDPVAQTNFEEEVINTQKALWTIHNPSIEQHHEFYRFLMGSSRGGSMGSGEADDKPLYTLQFNADVPLSIKSIFYVPPNPPMRLFSNQRDHEVSVALYSRCVLIQKAASQIIPRWLSFIKGVIDCEDISLNVSRETVQDTALMKRLSNAVVTRILRHLLDEAKKDKSSYLQFYRSYSQNLKEGYLDEVHLAETGKGGGGNHQKAIAQLLRFECSENPSGELISLEEYMNDAERRINGQSVEHGKGKEPRIYYFCASDRNTAMGSPYMEHYIAKKIPVLLCYDDIDEYLFLHLKGGGTNPYSNGRFVAINGDNADTDDLDEELDGDETNDKKDADEKSCEAAGDDTGDGADASRATAESLSATEQAELSNYIKEVLGGKVSRVVMSRKLVKSPAVVSGFLSQPIRKMLKATMKGNGGGGGDVDGGLFGDLPVTLELNPRHEVVRDLLALKEEREDVARLVISQLFDNACIAAGILEEPRMMLDRLNKILLVVAKHHRRQHNDPISTDDPTSATAPISAASATSSATSSST